MYDIQKDYYKILEIERTATAEELRRSFIRLSKKFHPDRFVYGSVQQKDAEKIFANITEAYSILSNPARKRNYDELKQIRDASSGVKQENTVNWAEHYYTEGEEALKRKKIDEAVTNLRESVKLNSGVAKYHAMLGVAYMQKGWQAYAKASFITALKIDPVNITSKKYMQNMGEPITPPPKNQPHPSSPSSPSPFSNIFKKK